MSCTEHTAAVTMRSSAVTVLRQFLGQFLPSFQQASETGSAPVPTSQMGKLGHTEGLSAGSLGPWHRQDAGACPSSSQGSEEPPYVQRYGPLTQDTSSELISVSLRSCTDTAQRGKDSH